MEKAKNKEKLLEELYRPYRACTGCHFKMPKATQIVFGEGNPDAPLVFIGEAPGRDEDLQGRPFVGRSGKLLDKIIEALGSQRNKLFITNIVKIRPPQNRRPLPNEMGASKSLLMEQIKIIRPKVICTLGSSALEGLLGGPVKITQTRGKPIPWNNIIIIPTYHPAYILRNQKELATLMADIEKALALAL